MAEERERRRQPAVEGGFDREINYRGLTWFTLGLALVIVLACLAMWWFSESLRTRLAEQDPAPPALEEARQPHQPPAPTLQTSFTGDIQELRAYESGLLEGYAWIDRDAGLARIPISRAMVIVAERGLPVVQEPAARPEGVAPETSNAPERSDEAEAGGE